MKKIIVKKITYMLVALMVVSALSGCALVPSLSLTSEQNDLIAEYSAGLLLKYQKGHSNGLSPVSNIKEESTEEIVVETPEPVVEQVVVESEPEPIVETPEVEIAVAGDELYSAQSIDQAMGIDGFAISYNTYEIKKIYPEQDSDELVFSMQASPGSNLLVLHMNVTNISDVNAVCNTMNSGVKARVSVNGGDRIPAQTTILMNDVFTLNEEIAPFGMIDAVAIFEIPEELGDSLSSLDFIIRNDAGENVYKLL